MDSNRKFPSKLAPLNGVAPGDTKDKNRLKGGCTNLMHACQQGLTDTIVKEVRKQVNVKHNSCFLAEASLSFRTINICLPIKRSNVYTFFLSERENWVMVADVNFPSRSMSVWKECSMQLRFIYCRR